MPVNHDTADGFSRRGFLRSTAGGAAAIVLAGFLPAGCSRDYPQSGRDGADLKSLTEKEYAITRAAAEAFLVGVPVEASAVARRIDQELARAGDPMLTDFKTVLGLMEHLTLLGGRVTRFTALTPEARLAYLDTWRRSRFTLRRGAYYGLKGFINYTTYIDPATRALTGFEGPWPERFKFPVRPVDFGDVT